MSLQDNIRNGLLTAGTILPAPDNQPSQYADRQTRYFERRTSAFLRNKAKYSVDYMAGEAQGLFDDAPQEWTPIRLRMADVVRPSAAITRRFDDYKTILIAEPPIDYVRQGTKIRTMGCTWLVTNPSNLSNTVGNGIAQRCNAVWNHLDYYGNVVSEPIVAENLRAHAATPDDQDSALITKGYFVLVMQYNKDTAQLDTNSRLILGTAAYVVTGYSDFVQEFTGDYSSVRLVSFDARYEEPNDEIDDMENHVAGGKTFSWVIGIDGSPTLKIGSAASYAATSERNGEMVVSTEEHPVFYEWTSSDESVFTVDENGTVTAVGEGSATLTATLVQNPTLSQTLEITVVNVDTTPHIEFINTIPPTLEAYDSVTLTAGYFEGGEQIGQVVKWTLSGAEPGSYSYSAEQIGPDPTLPSLSLYPSPVTLPNMVNLTANTVTIYGWSGSVTPLTVTATYGGVSNSVEIILLGI